MAKDRAEARRTQFARLAPSPLADAVQSGAGGTSLSSSSGLPAAARALASRTAAGILRASHLVSDHHRNALMLAVFGFKVRRRDD